MRGTTRQKAPISVSENTTREMMEVGVGVGISLLKEMRCGSRGGVDSPLSQIAGGEVFGNCLDVSFHSGKESSALGSG